MIEGQLSRLSVRKRTFRIPPIPVIGFVRESARKPTLASQLEMVNAEEYGRYAATVTTSVVEQAGQLLIAAAGAGPG